MRLFWTALVVLALSAAGYLVWSHSGSRDFVPLMNRGNNLVRKGDVAAAAEAYKKALEASPESTDVRLNLANAYLKLNRDDEALEMARQALALDRNNPAAFYLMGCAYMHLSQWQAAVQAFQQSQSIDARVTALNFQLGLAHEALGQRQEALNDFLAVTTYDTNHPTAHFILSRLYKRMGDDAEADLELKAQERVGGKGAAPSDTAALEQCKYTVPLDPFILEQPSSPGVSVKFTDVTATAFGGHASDFRGPLAIVDYAHDGKNNLFAHKADGAFQLLNNAAGIFQPSGPALPSRKGADYSAAVVGDIGDDGVSSVVVFGKEGSRLFRISTAGKAQDYSEGSGLGQLKASSGMLADLDVTGNLDIVTVKADGSGIEVAKNLGSMSFDLGVDDTGIPQKIAGASSVDLEDWGNDGLPGVFVTTGGKPQFFTKRRASTFAPAGVADGWPAAKLFAAGDLNNDLELDVVLVTTDSLEVVLSGRKEYLVLPLGGFQPAGLLLVDFDNDGWLDILAYGSQGLRVWRNEGHAGFRDVTASLGLGSVGAVDGALAADFDGKGASDLILSTPKGLELWRNEGAQVNRQMKLSLKGTRSNASALGMRLELSSGNWRTSRTVHALPVEIGVGAHAKLDALTIHWSDLATTQLDVPVAKEPLAVVEPKLPSGSCPYLYVWDGEKYRFVTDILGAAPLGLPLSKSRFVPSNPEELLSLGDDLGLQPRNGAYQIRLTDELREILYLDEARLISVDHPKGTLVYTTSKLRPAPPFPKPEIWILRPLTAPLSAVRSDGTDVTANLSQVDSRMVSPVALRRPQLRGMADPYSVTMDFGPLDGRRNPVLALTGWLQFGGGMANIGASIDPTVGPPFPTMEAELPDGSWQKVATDVGAPCGKTKTILVDLEGRLPKGARRLRLSTSFEIHWDAAMLCERIDSAGMREQSVHADTADLHWRGFSHYLPQPESQPLTPVYDEVVGAPPWDRTPSGWCTRYGDVRELIRGEGGKLAILNGGDELSLSFDTGDLAAKPEGMVRDFFLYAYGWDKDADFHVYRGWEVAPLPFRGMADLDYGKQERPESLGGSWIDTYNTRWVGPVVLARKPSPSR